VKLAGARCFLRRVRAERRVRTLPFHKPDLQTDSLALMRTVAASRSKANAFQPTTQVAQSRIEFVPIRAATSAWLRPNRSAAALEDFVKKLEFPGKPVVFAF